MGGCSVFCSNQSFGETGLGIDQSGLEKRRDCCCQASRSSTTSSRSTASGWTGGSLDENAWRGTTGASSSEWWWWLVGGGCCCSFVACLLVSHLTTEPRITLYEVKRGQHHHQVRSRGGRGGGRPLICCLPCLHGLRTIDHVSLSRRSSPRVTFCCLPCYPSQGGAARE